MSVEPTSLNDFSPALIGAPSLAPQRVDLETLAKQHGVAAIADPDSLRGDFWPVDESLDEFLLALRASRRDAAQ